MQHVTCSHEAPCRLYSSNVGTMLQGISVIPVSFKRKHRPGCNHLPTLVVPHRKRGSVLAWERHPLSQAPAPLAETFP